MDTLAALQADATLEVLLGTRPTFTSQLTLKKKVATMRDAVKTADAAREARAAAEVGVVSLHLPSRPMICARCCCCCCCGYYQVPAQLV
jgi:hypothetical protein